MHRKTSDRERALALRDVMEHAVRVQREITAPTLLRRPRGLRVGALVAPLLLLGLSAYSVIDRPAYIWGESAKPAAAETEAGLRVGMYLMAQRIEAFRSERGRYPSAVGAIGEAVEGVKYTVLSDSVFELRGSTQDTVLVLRSDQAVDEFLGTSMTRITSRGAQ